MPWLGAEPAAPLRDRAVSVESLYAWRHYGGAPQKAQVDDTHKLIDATTPERYSRKDRLGERDLAPRRPKEVAAMRGRLSALTATLVRDQATAGEAAASSDRIPMLEMLGCLTASAADRKYVDSF